MEVINTTKANFESEVLKSDKPVVVDFWASWCGPCQMLHPIIDEIAQKVDKIKVCKININDEPELTEQYDVMSIPTLLFMKEGKIVQRTQGFQSKAEILKMMQL